MGRDDLGYWSIPANGLGIVRARTLLGNLRLWDFPRSEAAFLQVVQEISQAPIPGVYVLIDERPNKKVYVGQTENLANRLLSHIKTPEAKIRNWQRALVFNDGRSSPQSDLTEENVRLALEDYLVQLFKINRYEVVTSATRAPVLSPQQTVLVNAYREEINWLLSNKEKVSRFIFGKRDDEIYLDDVKRMLIQRGHTIQEWGTLYGVVDGQPTIIRPGSKKEKGWQITFRGSKSLAQLKKRDRFLAHP
ncbi:MAG: GIY-YIG nuclease family protein [Anaerolineales bacterium]|nr:GIY-YIG nuclease family protein [Anaerolineales bacterium]MCX7608776.1 GIY-YIG nuclease family protein [Anaerolineales bacterium]MDW8226703.1 GIY-YIG nuclease family protein [Anaerolineales bacterium]